MRGVFGWTVLCFLGLTLAAGAETPQSLERLIEQLGDRDFRVRDQASKAILAQGVAALGALNKSRAHPDVEVRQRLEDLIGQLERQAALAPRRVSLHLAKKPIADALAEIARQSGYKIPLDGQVGTVAKQTPGSFDFDNMLFWEAFDRICEPAGLTLQQAEGDSTLRLATLNSYVPFRSYDGTFKITATGFNYSVNSQFGQISRNAAPAPTSQESLQFNLLVSVEPRLPIMRLGQVRLTAAEDEERHSMLLPDQNFNNGMFPQQQMRFYRGAMQRSYSQGAAVGLVWPAKTSRTVKVLKGVIPVTLLAEQKPVVVIDQIASAVGKTFRAGSATFHVLEVTKQSNNQMQIRVTFNDETLNNSFDYSQVQLVPQRVELQDTKGKKIPANGQIQMYHGPSSVDFVIRTQSRNDKEVGPPARLIFQHWVQMDHEVAFEFKGLPLP